MAIAPQDYWMLGSLSVLSILLVLLFATWRWQRSSLVLLTRLMDERQEADRLQGDRWLQLDRRLREQEREYQRQLGEARNSIVERMVRAHHLQQKASHELQEQLLLRYGHLYRELEQRFGEMQKHLMEDAGRLRTDLLERFESLREATRESLAEGSLTQQQTLAGLRESLQSRLNGHRQEVEQRHGEALRVQQETLSQGMQAVMRHVEAALDRNASELGRQVGGLTEVTEERLKAISGQVESRLNEGFSKTTETFSKVLTHLARIDEAQKRITELSNSVISLQEVLADKRSRGAFGEVQLQALVPNLLPASSYAFQHSLSNETRVDCMLFLPEPTGSLGVDAKFPLESFRRMTDIELSDHRRARAAVQFRVDIRRHITALAGKYIVPGETSDGAVMFIPAEAVFAEIHAHFPDLVEEAHRRRVWMVSPTTMMAILTTARAVLKDAATRDQVHLIRQHLHDLSRDFRRFQQRMDNLSRHIHQASKDVDEVSVSARKISGRFDRIERVELVDEAGSVPLETKPDVRLTGKGKG